MVYFNVHLGMSDLPISYPKHFISNSWTHAKTTSVLLKQPSPSLMVFTKSHICCKIVLTLQFSIILFQTSQLISISSFLCLICYLQMTLFFYFMQLLNFIYPTFHQHLILSFSRSILTLDFCHSLLSSSWTLIKQSVQFISLVFL